jgi:hypothetical protein
VVGARLLRSRGAALWLLLGVACAKSPPPGSEKLELPAPPAAHDMPIALGYVFGDAVELLGAKVTPQQGLKPGARVDVTLYWRRRASVPSGFRLFTHLLDAAGERILTLDAAGPLRQPAGGAPAMPPSAWREGKVYVDGFSFTVPQNVKTSSISLVCGLFLDRERLPVTQRPPSGKRRHETDRALVATLGVSLPSLVSPNVVPDLWVPRQWQPIVIDGKLDEPGWQRTASTPAFVNVASGEAPSVDDVTATVKATYNEEALYLGFEVFDDDLRGGFDPALPDPHLWTRDAVEIMIDPDGDGDNLDYYEIQVGPQNLVFDSRFDGYNVPRGGPDGPFGHQEWSSGLKSAVELRGTLDDARPDEGYVVELEIPWSSFAKARHAPPAKGDVWRMNFYAVENNSGSAWSPILGQGNFHKAARFGRVHFVPALRPGR